MHLFFISLASFFVSRTHEKMYSDGVKLASLQGEGGSPPICQTRILLELFSYQNPAFFKIYIFLIIFFGKNSTYSNPVISSLIDIILYTLNVTYLTFCYVQHYPINPNSDEVLDNISKNESNIFSLCYFHQLNTILLLYFSPQAIYQILHTEIDYCKRL